MPGEQLPGEADELTRQLMEASEPDPTVGGVDPDKAKRRHHKMRRNLIRQLSWTPFHAFGRRASARPACTDVACLLPLLITWLVLVAVAVLGGRYGHPARLLYGLDYERNTCGVNNALISTEMRFEHARASTFPYEIDLPTAHFAPGLTNTQREDLDASLNTSTMRTGVRDLSGGNPRWLTPVSGARYLTYYADPASRLAVCVSACPAPSSVSAPTHVCSYDSAAGATTPALANTTIFNSSAPWCMPTYRTAAVAGYCVPAAPEAQNVYDAAGLPFGASDLAELRRQLSSAGNGRFFDATVGDVVASWPLLVGIPIVTVVLVLAYTICVTYTPLVLYVLTCIMALTSLSCLTYVLWTEGNDRQAAIDASGLSRCTDSTVDGSCVPTWAADTATWLHNSGYCMCALTVLYLFYAVGGYVMGISSMPLLQVAGALLTTTPTALIAPLLAVLAQLGFCACWLVAAAYIAASGELEINAHGHAILSYASGIKGLFVVHLLGGLWTAMFIKHLGLVGAAGPLGRAYWRAAESKWERLGVGMLRTILSPLLHVGSAAFGAILCTLLEPIGTLLQAFGITTPLNNFQTAGYIHVALFGTSLTNGSRWGSAITARFAPQLLKMQARVSLLLWTAKFGWALTATAVAAAFLTSHPDFDRASGHFSSDGGVSSLYVPLIAVYTLTWLLCSTLLATLELAVASGVHNWCLDYKQNCIDQGLEKEEMATWMMAVSEAPSLTDLHEYMQDELDAASDMRLRRDKDAAAAKRKGTATRGRGPAVGRGLAKGGAPATASPKKGKPKGDAKTITVQIGTLKLDEAKAKGVEKVKIVVDMPGSYDDDQLRVTPAVKLAGGKANLKSTEKFDAAKGTPLRAALEEAIATDTPEDSEIMLLVSTITKEGKEKEVGVVTVSLEADVLGKDKDLPMAPRPLVDKKNAQIGELNVAVSALAVMLDAEKKVTGGGGGMVGDVLEDDEPKPAGGAPPPALPAAEADIEAGQAAADDPEGGARRRRPPA